MTCLQIVANTDIGKILLGQEMDTPVVEVDVNRGEMKPVDVHVWRVGRQSYSCAHSVVTNDPQLAASKISDRLGVHKEIMHSTIEIHYRQRP